MSKINVNILIICLICLIAVGTASAADFNQSDVSVSDEVQVDLNEPLENDIGEASTEDASADVNETSQGSDVIGISNEENTLGDAGTRNALTTKINAASSGETVDLENDYTLSYSEYAISISKPITIDGHGHTINAGGSRVFTITAGSKVTLQNIKFTNCGQYGVIYAGDYGYSTYTLDLINCTFYNLNPSTGSPSYSYGAIQGGAYLNLNVTNCKFINGSGTTAYRAMYFGRQSNVNIVNSTFDDNRNNNGGAIYFAESGNKVTIVNSTFEDNYAWRTYSSSSYYSSYYYGGGAIYFSGGTNVVTISGSTFRNNHAMYDGGAIYLRGTNTLTCTDSTFEDNYAVYHGGAIYTNGVANYKFENCTFENNYIASTDTSSSSSTMYGGGAIYLASTANLNINGSTFRGNRASYGSGGVIYFSSTSNNVNITNSDFDSNYVSYPNYNYYHYNGNGGVLYYSTGGASNKLNIINSTFESNHADYTYSTTSYAERRANGGVAYFMGACNVVVEGSTFDDNYVSHTYYASRYNKGGVFYFAESSDIKIGNSTFEGNRAVQYGGVIYLSKSSTVVISNHSTFRNNHIDYDATGGPYGGGVLYSYEKISLNVSDSVFDSNYADSGSGGAFYLTGYDHNIVLFNSIFENNYAQTSYSSNGIGNGGAFYIKNNVASFIINKTTFERNHVYYTYTSGSSYNQNAEGGAIFFGSTSPVDIINSTFDANYAKSLNSGSTPGSGGAIYFAAASTVRINDTYFINNNATCDGGAIYFYSVSDVNIYNTHFNNNQVSGNQRRGGAIYVSAAVSGNKFDISKSTFENNYATYGGVIYISSSTALNLNIKDSTFKSDKNVSSGAVLHVASSANIKIENSRFDNFVSTRSGSVISTSDSTTRVDLKIHDSSFTNNSAISKSSVYGGVISLSKGASLELVNASFINSTVKSDYASFGGALAIKSSSVQNVLTILNSTFDGNSAPNYGAIYLDGISGNVLINGSKFVNNLATSSYGDGGAIRLCGHGSTVISNTLFENNRANGYGGAIYAYDAANCQIINSVFNNNMAPSGGAIYVSYGLSSLTVDKSKFTNNRAEKVAGAIYLPNSAANVIISETSFDKNSVFKGNGGALYFAASSNNTQISSSNFTDNYVQYGHGGAIFMGSLISNTHIENSLFKNNSAGCFNLSENDGVDSGSYYGGAIFVASSAAQNEFINITCIDNKASYVGGAIYYYGGDAVVRDSYFTDNTAHYGSAIFLGKTNSNSNSISNSYFANNPANSTELDVTISSSSSSITVKHAGGNNYINAIYSYDENINFDNVQYFEYDAGNGGMYTVNPSRQDYKAYQTIFIDVYDENDQVISTISGKTDEEGKWVIDYPNLSNIKYVKVYRLADDYYSYIEAIKLYKLGDFDILQGLINDLDENGVLVLDRNYTYSIGYDSIVDGIVIDKKITVDGNGYTINALDKSRIFYLAADGIKLTNIVYTEAFTDGNGGAIYGVGVNDIVIEDSIFTEISAKKGGAVYLEGNDSLIDNATFFLNGYKYTGYVLGRDEIARTASAPSYTAVMGRLEIMEMYLSGSDDLYASSTIAPYPAYGGAVYLEGSNLKITDSNFTYNVAILGGAVFINGTDSAIENSFFNLNMAFAGGAVYAEGNNITVSDSIFVENMAEGFMFYKYYPDPVQEPEPEPGEPQVTTQQEICPRPADDELLTAPVMSRDIPEADSEESNGPRTDAPIGEEVPFTDSTALAHKEYIGGAAIHMAADNSKVINSRFVLNQNDETIGGAIYWLGKNGEVSGSHFAWNVADYGGAIYWDCEADNGLIDNCYFKHEPEDINILASAYEYYYMGNVMEQLGNYSNIAHRGAAIFYDGYNGIISNSVFENNIAVEHGGAISVHGNSTTVSDCQFNNNTIGDLGISSIYSTISPYERGGSSVVWYGNDGKLVNSNFTNHNSNYTVLLWMGEDAHIYTNTMEVDLSYQHKYGNNGLIENCLFRDNHGAIEALVEWIGYNGTISNSEFYNNSAEYCGAVLWLGTDGKIIDTEFTRNYGRYAAFLGIGYNTSIVRCTFDENVGILGVVYQGMELEEYNEYTFEINEFTEYTATSKLLIEDSTFTNNYALVATVIDSSYKSKISNSRFYNNSNYHTALLIMGGESSVDGCNFTDNTGFAGSALMVGYIDVDNSYYFAGSETIGDPYSIIEQFGWDVTVSNSRFTNNTAQLGGAVSWFGLNGTMENSIFIGNGFKEYDYNALLDASENTSSLLYYGQDMEYFHNIFEEAFTAVFKKAAGGAMNWMGVNGLVNNCTFENNSALAENVAEHYGGAVCWQGDDGVINASTFVNNFASKGGSVFWVGEWGTIANSTFNQNRIPSVKTEFKYDNYTAAVYQYFDYNFVYNDYSYAEDELAAAQAHYDEAFAYVSASHTYDELEYIWYIANYHEAFAPKAGEGSPAYLEINYVFLLKNRLEFNATAPSFGGAVYWYGEHGLIYNSTFTNNSATQGGAVYWNGYYGGIQDSIFNENTGTGIDAVIFSREMVDGYVNTQTAEYNVYSQEDCEKVIREIIATEIYNIYGDINWGIEEGEFNEFSFNVLDVTYYPYEPQVTTQQEIMVNPAYKAGSDYRLTTEEFESGSYRFEVTFDVRLYNTTYRTGSYKSAGGAVYWNAEDLPEFNPIYPPMPNTPVDPTPGEVVSRSTNPGGNLKAAADSRDILGDGDDDYYDDVVEQQQTGYQPGYIYNCTFIKNSVEEGGAVYWATPEGILASSRFVNNSASYGGAVYGNGSYLLINGSEFISNNAGYGAAVYMLGDMGMINESSFIANTATYGGAVYYDGYDNVILGSEFRLNKAKSGSALYVASDIIYIANTTLLDNQAYYDSLFSTFVVDGNTLTVEAAFSGKDNLMNAIFVTGDFFIQNVTYWSVDGVTNSDIDVPSVSELEAGQNITLEMINVDFETTTFVAVTDINGEVGFYVPNIRGGRHIVVVSHKEDNYYTAVSRFEVIIFKTFEPELEVNVDDIYYHENATVNVKLNSEAKGNVTIYLDGVEVAIENITGGVATLNLAGLDAGKYNVEVFYPGDGLYLNGTASATFNVFKINSTIEVSTVNVTDGVEVPVNITVGPYDDLTGYVYITIDGIYGTSLEVNGRELQTVVRNLFDGEYNVTVHYVGDNNYYASTNTTSFTVEHSVAQELATVYSINANITDISYLENATANITVSPALNGTVSVVVDGKTYTGEVIDGNVLVNIYGLSAGVKIATVDFTSSNGRVNLTTTTKFEVFKINSTIVISTVNVTDGAEVPVNITVGPYDDLTGNVYVTIEGIYGAALKVNGRELQTVVKNLADGEYNITAHYVGDNNYYASTNTTSFTVENSVAQALVTAYSINANITDISYLENATANITVSPALNGTVSVVVDGKTYTGEVIDGNVLVNLYGLSGGVKTATVDFTSSNGRVNLTTTTKFEVFRLPTAVDIVVSGKDVAISVTEGATGVLSVYINGAKFDYSYVGETIALSNVLTIGNNTIVAIYAGNENYTDSQNVTNAPISKAVPQVSVSADDIFFGADAVIVVNVGDRQTGYITLTVNNTNYNAVIDNNPMIVFTIPGLAVANYPVEVTYSGDAVFDSASNSTDFNVIKADMSTSATVVGLNVTVLDNTVFVIGVPSNFNGFVNITVDGEKYSGAIEPVITMARLVDGNKVANVVFWGDANYDDFELLAPFTVSRVFTNVTVDVGEVTYPGEAIAHVTVSGMANGTVVLTVDGKVYDAADVVNGQATVELGRFDSGIKNITADFKVTDSINMNATDDSKFAVNKAHTAVGIATENENVIISVTAGATGKVTLYVNGNKKEYTFTGDNLVWENILIVGNNTIVAIYDGNENYEGSQNTTNVIMGKKNSSVNVAAETITYGSDAVIVVNVGEGQTGFVTINVNNKEYSAEIINGGASFTIPGLNVASYPVSVRYSGDVNFTSQENSTTLTVNKADLTASVVGENVTVNENTVFVVSGVPADFNGKLNITVDGEKYSGDANALIKMAKLTAGNKIADVIFYGDANYNDLALTAPFTVSRVSAAESGVTTMTVTVTDVTYPEVATAIVSVSGNANGTVTITVDGKAYDAIEVVNGNAVVDLGILSAGVKDLAAEFAVTDAINSNASATTMFVVEKAATALDIATEGKDVTVNVTSGATGDITVYINGEKTDYAYTGEAIVISNALAIGNNTIFAVYAGNENYSGSQNNAEAFIAKNKSQVSVSAEDIEYGRDAIIIVNVGEGQTGYVTITVNDKTYSAIIDAGQILFSIHGLAVGNYPVSVSYLGDDTFLPEVNSTSFAVTQRDMGISASVVGQDVLVTQNTSFIISVPSDFGGYVNITVDGISYSGPVSPTITMARLSDGKKVADVVFWGDKNYNDFALTAPFTVSRIETSMNVEVQDVVYLNNATAIVSVSGNANGTVAVTVGDRKYDAVDVINGYATVELGMLPAGIKTVTAEFTVTDAFYKNAAAATKFAVEKAGTAVSIRTDGYDVMVNVTEGATGTVSVYVNGNKKEFTFDGTELIWENALIVGDNAIVAVYDGNENYEGSQNAIDANIDKLESTVSVSADDVTYDADAVIVVTVGEGQTGLVTITVAGKEYSSEIKGSEATFIVPGLNAGEYNVTVTYSGDFNYTSQTNETMFNVRKANLTATVEGEDITVNDYSSFVINNVPSNYKGKVNITVDDEFYSGDVSSLIRMGKLTAGIKVANVVFYGDNNYNDLGLLVSFEVSRVSMSQAGITIMSVTVDDVTYPDEATAVISITGNARGMVTVTVNGVEYEPVEVIGGFALVELGQLSAGLKLLTAEFIVSDMVNNNATATTQFNVIQANSTVDIEFDGTNVIVNVNSGEPGKLHVYINGAVNELTYDGNEVVFENALIIGDNTVLAIFDGSENYTGSQNTRNLTIPKKESTVSVSAADITYGSQAVIVVTVPVDETGYATIVVDGKNYTAFISEGKATFNVTGLKVAKYDVSVTYQGNENYTSQVNQTTFNVGKADLNANVIGQNITTADSAAFVVSVPDDFTGNVNITVDGISYSGNVSTLIKMSKLSEGAKVANVVFWDDPNYNVLALDAPFKVSTIVSVFEITTIKADNMTRAWNSEFDYQAAFLNKDGSALANETVKFKVKGKTYTATTNEDGIAHLIGVTLDVGTYKITSINPVTGEQITNTLKIVKRITENKNIVMDYRDGTKFRVKVFGDNGTVAPKGEIISFYINGIYYVGKVDSTGHASVKIKLLPKTYTIVAEYKGFKTTNKIKVKQILKVSKKTIKVKKSVKVIKFKATLKYSNGKALKNKVITFKFKGKTYKAKTNKKGVAQIKIKKKSFKKLKKGKKYKVTVAYTIKEKYGNDIVPISDRVYCYVKVSKK